MVLGPLARGDVPGVCARACAALEAAPGAPLVCEAGGLGRPDLVTVDVLARLRLAARRHGRAYRIRDAPPALTDMVGFLGLDRAIPAGGEPGEADRRRSAVPPGPEASGRAAGDDARASPRGSLLGDRLQPVREPEQREQLLGVEEGVHADDAPV